MVTLSAIAPLIPLSGSALSLASFVTTSTPFLITPPWFWFLSGLGLAAVEFLLLRKLPPQFRFIALMMAVCCIILSLILWRTSAILGFNWQYTMYEHFDVQVMYWMGLSMAFSIWIRPVLIPRKRYIVPDAAEATTLTDIIPGQNGRVLYEGSSWQATCDTYHGAIAPNQKVYILRREGNTLVVAPEQLFKS